MGKYTNDKRILTGVGLLVTTLLVVASLSPRITSGNEADELENDLQATRNQIQQYESQLNNTKAQIEAAKRQAASYAGALQSYSGQMAYAQAQLEQTRLELEEKQLELENTEAKVREATLAVQYHERVLKRVARDFYKKSFGGNIAFWFSESTFGDAARTATYRSRVSDNFHEELSKIVGMLDHLVKQKEQLAADKENFEKQQQELTDRQAYLRNQIATANTNLSQSQGQQQRLTSDLAAIQDKLAQLNAQQQAILAQRSGGFTVNADTLYADDYNASLQGFNESAPSGYFGVFSIGAFTHRNGMSQWGALGRANSGQNAEQILAAYYPSKQLVKNYEEPTEIHVRGNGISCYVQGYNSDGSPHYNKYYDEVVSFDKYLKGIYEVYGSWPQPVLQAQAVAARTYAIRIGGPIQPNQSHQVYKDCAKGDSWTTAVDATDNWVLLENGAPAFTEYSSTTGGWINNVGWDTTDGTGGNNFINKTYEKLAGSPWVYKAWYTKEANNSGKCGRSNAWLSPIEMADIINAAIVLYGTGSGADIGRIVPVTTSCWPGNPYSHDELRDVSKNYTLPGFGTGGVSSVSDVLVVQGSSGTTSQVIFQTDKGEKRFKGTEFKAIFNTRAPGYLGIQQSGFSFFNIEHK